MKIEKAKKQYRNQWILATVVKEDPETKEPLDIEIIEHSPLRSKTQAAMRKSRHKHLLHLYTGPIPKKGYAVAF